MSDEPKESYLNNLERSFEKAWDLLNNGAKDRHSPLHTPVVASMVDDQNLSQRVMVLRHADQENRILQFNTDRRAHKVDQIVANNRVSVLGYHPGAKVQLRLHGTGKIQTMGGQLDAAWEQASPYGKRCYLAEPGPGTLVPKPTSGLSDEIEGQRPSDEQLSPAKQNFAILQIQINRLEWLYLAHTGHRRALFQWGEESHVWDGEWLVP